MSPRIKLFLIAAIAIPGFLNVFLQRVRIQADRQRLASRGKVPVLKSMLEARRLEKDFLTRRKVKYLHMRHQERPGCLLSIQQNAEVAVKAQKTKDLWTNVTAFIAVANKAWL